MPELRKDPIIGRWVIISTSRGKRPVDFTPDIKDEKSLTNCPFCSHREGMTPPEIFSVRESGTQPNTPGWKVRVVPNKFPALGLEDGYSKRGIGMYDLMSGFGAHEVVIETPDHFKTVKDMSVGDLSISLTVCQDRLQDLYRDVRMRYVLIFKNEGPQAGASLAHPHSQIIATPITPKRVKEELIGASEYYKSKERCIFCDIISQEKDAGSRVVYENDHYICFCPFASRFPFEMWLMPKLHESDFYTARANISALAQALKTVMEKLAAALNNPQYNYIVHTSPNRTPRRGYWQTITEDYHWHIEIMPRLTRIAGFEWGTGFYINPTAPEDAAKYLREVAVSA